MEKYKEITGNLISLALLGEFDVIAHGCNCRSTMGAGIAVQMAKTFRCDKFIMELDGPSILKLGNIDFQRFVISANGAIWEIQYDSEKSNKMNEPELVVVNAYTQNWYGRNHLDGNKTPVDYEAITLCMRKINSIFAGKSIGLPQIGCGLAGGTWDIVKHIIQKELKDCNVTVVIYDGN